MYYKAFDCCSLPPAEVVYIYRGLFHSFIVCSFVTSVFASSTPGDTMSGTSYDPFIIILIGLSRLRLARGRSCNRLNLSSLTVFLKELKSGLDVA